MSIVLTGDVHQRLSGAADQRRTDRTEPELALEYARIAAEYGLKVTLFITARAILQNAAAAETLSRMDNVEIAGHGWDALRPLWWHGVLNLLTGSPHGPARLQQHMIRRTCAVIGDLTGRPVRSWRNHAYRHDEHTARLLASAGVLVWSDVVNPRLRGPAGHRDGVTLLPINTLPDHENMSHHGRGVHGGSDDALAPAQWCQRVCEQVDEIAARGGTATILAHPICMQVADQWMTYDRLCRFLSRYSSQFASETAPGQAGVPG